MKRDYITILSLWDFLNQRRKFQLRMLFLLMLLVSFLDVFSISAVFPFLTALINPSQLEKNSLIIQVMSFLKYSTVQDLLPLLTIVFISAIILSAIMRFSLLWSTSKIAFGVGADFGLKIYNIIINKPYQYHISVNSSEIINSVASKANGVVFNGIIPAITVLTAFFSLLISIFALMMLEQYIALLGVFFFGILYAFFIKFYRKRLFSYSKDIAEYSTSVIKIIQESLGSIRSILLENNQDIYSKIFSQTDLRLKYAQSKSFIAGSLPKYIIECIGIISLIWYAYIISSQPSGIGGGLALLGVLALGAQKLLPIFQQAYASWSILQSSAASLLEIEQILRSGPNKSQSDNFSPDSVVRPILFKNKIQLVNLSFKYENCDNYILRNINLVIQRGDRVGFIGETGSGKSTLMDIIMGLLPPSGGHILVDDIRVDESNYHLWRSHISNVPQDIFLVDGTIEENIAFGSLASEINRDLVIEVSKQAMIYDFISKQSHGFDTLVGERGVRLSGGQKQRIGIARALYRQREIIVLDEATSALDGETEEKIMEAMNLKDRRLTYLMIAHRLSTLKNCNLIFKLKDGSLIPSSYAK